MYTNKLVNQIMLKKDNKGIHNVEIKLVLVLPVL